MRFESPKHLALCLYSSAVEPGLSKEEKAALALKCQDEALELWSEHAADEEK